MTARTMIYIFSHNYELSVSWVAPAASFLYMGALGGLRLNQEKYISYVHAAALPL